MENGKDNDPNKDKLLKDEMRQRISQLIELKNMDRSAFAQAIGMSQSNLSHLLSGRNDPSLNTVLQIHNAFPEVNIDWLIYGKGAGPSDNPPVSDNESDIFLQTQFSATENNIEKQTVEEETPQPKGNSEQRVIEKHRIEYIEKPQRKIMEIRIFYDDNTFDVFFPNRQ